MSGAGVSGGSSYCGTTMRELHVTPLLVQGGGGSREGRAVALL